MYEPSDKCCLLLTLMSLGSLFLSIYTYDITGDAYDVMLICGSMFTLALSLIMLIARAKP